MDLSQFTEKLSKDVKNESGSLEYLFQYSLLSVISGEEGSPSHTALFYNLVFTPRFVSNDDSFLSRKHIQYVMTIIDDNDRCAGKALPFVPSGYSLKSAEMIPTPAWQKEAVRDCAVTGAMEESTLKREDFPNMPPELGKDVLDFFFSAPWVERAAAYLNKIPTETAEFTFEFPGKKDLTYLLTYPAKFEIMYRDA
jgi:hypothetical protein